VPLSLLSVAITPVIYKTLPAYSQQGLHLIPYLRLYAGVLMATGFTDHNAMGRRPVSRRF
jgi:hypothetical protein